MRPPASQARAGRAGKRAHPISGPAGPADNKCGDGYIGLTIRPARVRGQGRSCSSWAATASSCASPPGRATSWTASGCPRGSRPAGTAIAGQPARFHGAQNGAYRALRQHVGQPAALRPALAAIGGWARPGVTSTSCSAKNVLGPLLPPAPAALARQRRAAARAGRPRRAGRSAARSCARSTQQPGVELGAGRPAHHLATRAAPARTAGRRRRPCARRRAAGRRSRARPRPSAGRPGRRGIGAASTPRCAAAAARHVGELGPTGQHARASSAASCDRRGQRPVLGHAEPRAVAELGRHDAEAGLDARPARSTRPGCGSSPCRRCRSAIGTVPAATAAAEPPDEPPGVRAGSHGLRVMPNAESVVPNTHSSGTRVSPTTTAPAARSRRTTSWSALCGAASVPAEPTAHRLAGDRHVVLDRDRARRPAAARPGRRGRRPRRPRAARRRPAPPGTRRSRRPRPRCGPARPRPRARAVSWPARTAAAISAAVSVMGQRDVIASASAVGTSAAVAAGNRRGVAAALGRGPASSATVAGPNGGEYDVAGRAAALVQAADHADDAGRRRATDRR